MNTKRLNLIGKLTAILSILLILTGLSMWTASAHGKEVRITLTSWTPDPQKPLTRLYLATVVFAIDQEPVDNAKVELTAIREEGGAIISPTLFTPVKSNPGLYVAQITYPRFGNWRVTLQTEEPGEGKVTITDRVTPAIATASVATQTTEQARNLQLFFKFDWRDVARILVRISHSVAGVTYLGITGIMLFALWFKRYLTKSALWSGLKQAYLPLIIVSLLLILWSGIYTGYYDAPVKAPGVFDLNVMGKIPYGYAYLASFWVKAPLVFSMLVVALKIRQALREPSLAIVSGGAATEAAATSRNREKVAASPTVIRLTLAYGIIGFLLLANIAVLIYLHYLSHLSVILPPQ